MPASTRLHWSKIRFDALMPAWMAGDAAWRYLGFAVIGGMNEDLGIGTAQSGLAGGLFFLGYGAGYVCERAMRLGVVACGYADGYPRHAAKGDHSDLCALSRVVSVMPPVGSSPL